jgi:hypothetical protein
MATTLTLRLVKNSTLTFAELDSNFTSLKDNKLEASLNNDETALVVPSTKPVIFSGDVTIQGNLTASGAIGYTGSQGDVGFTGSAGAEGVAGTTGFTGSAGADGTAGATGFTGSQGLIGYTGSAGTGGGGGGGETFNAFLLMGA